MKQKLIMENWRKFLNESLTLEEIDQKYDSQLEEGVGTTLLTLATFVFGGQTIELDRSELELAQGMMNKIEQSGDTYAGVPVEDIRTEFDAYMLAAQNADYDADGISDRNVKIQDQTRGSAPDIIVGQLFQYVDGKGDPQQDTEDTADGDTGVETQHTMDVSVAINQMENAPTTEARNDWAQKILDYHEHMGEGSDVPPSVVERAEFYLGK
jgi:hypothetical protein